MVDVKTAGVPQVTVEKAVDILSASYVNIIESGVGLKSFPSVMLWGAPGVGKSQGVRQIAEKITEATGKKCVITDVRLLLFNPIDLRGIPTANKEKTLAVWLKPKIFEMDESESVINILFLDEISAAPQSVQAAAYQITLDRVVGEHRLPENCIVIAAGNRVTDKSVAYRMPKALANRLLHLEIESNFDSWKKWAVKNAIHDKVIGFLSFRRDYLMSADGIVSDDLAYATPRSWEYVSNVLRFVGGKVCENFDLIAGLVGTGVATEMSTWEKVYSVLPDIAGIFAGKETSVPKSTDALYALVAAMTRYAREHSSDLNGIENSIRYAERLPADYSVVLMKDYMSLKDLPVEKLRKLPSFQRWVREKGKFLNGSV